MTPKTRKELQDRVDKSLQEIRIVLPGTQALLGFQFVAFFNVSFSSLSSNLQLYHLFNLILVTISTLLLIAPVGFGEIRENGRNTARLLKFTSRMITTAMLFLLMGLAGDIFVAASLLSNHTQIIPALAAVVTFIAGFTLWFGLMFAKRDS